MLGQTLVTKQTGPPASASTGSTSRTAPTSRASSTSRCSSTGRVGRVAFVVSTEGGVDIEEVAAATPEKIVTVAIDPATGVPCRITDAASPSALKLEGRPRASRRRRRSSQTLYTAFLDKDMSLLEVNPLIVMKDGHLRVPRREDRASTTTRSSAIPTSRRCATRRRRTRRRSRRRNTISPTSRSTARSAAW